MAVGACLRIGELQDVQARLRAVPQVGGGDTVVALRTGGDHVFVRAESAGQDLLLLVDTGATALLVSDRTARRLQLRTIPLPTGSFVGVGGLCPAAAATLPDLTFGGLQLRTIAVVVVDLDVMQPTADHEAADGVIGSNLLRQLGARIDYRAGTLALHVPTPLAEKLPQTHLTDRPKP